MHYETTFYLCGADIWFVFKPVAKRVAREKLVKLVDYFPTEPERNC